MAEEDSFTSAMAKKANEYYDSLYPKAVAKPVGILAKLPWLKTLDADQQQNAILVAEEAKKQGVPVNYALSVANAESGLMHDLSKPSKKGAIGIMQLLPTTAPSPRRCSSSSTIRARSFNQCARRRAA